MLCLEINLLYQVYCDEWELTNDGEYKLFMNFKLEQVHQWFSFYFKCVVNILQWSITAFLLCSYSDSEQINKVSYINPW